MESFFSLLDRHVQVTNSLLCVGLDPHPSDLPEPTAEAALDFCLRLVKATARYAAAFKPNAAFFELYGPEGWAALKQVIEAIQAESHRIGSVIPVILDAKRGDIASTAEAYAASAFEKLGAHAITLSPYLGHDSIAPFIANRERGAFLLCKTSNPGAIDVQDLTVDGGRQTANRPPSTVALYEHIADLAQEWNTSNNIGLVVGATQPEALARVRARAPQMWFLAPGIGAQGGDLEAALSAGLRADGLGMLLPVSRGISRAEDWMTAARDLREAIEHQRYSLSKSIQSEGRAKRSPQAKDAALSNACASTAPLRGFAQDATTLADGLLQAGCIKFGAFTLKSGIQSPIYLDLRRLISNPPLLQLAARAYAETLRPLHFDRLAGLPYAALPIGTAIALEMNRPLIYPRREVKDYGTKAAIEGDYVAGETIAVIDDLATTGDTKIEAIRKLEAAGLKVKDIVVLIDREQGAKEMLAQAGYTLHAVTTLRALLEEWRVSGAISEAQYTEVLGFLTQ